MSQYDGILEGMIEVAQPAEPVEITLEQAQVLSSCGDMDWD